MKPYLLLAAMAALLAYSCKSEQAPKPEGPGTPGCETTQVTAAYVMAAIAANCTNRGCHPGGSAPAVANFSSADRLRSYIRDKEAIFRLRVTGPNADMPPSQQFPALSQGMRDSIACWISHGMPD